MGSTVQAMAAGGAVAGTVHGGVTYWVEGEATEAVMIKVLEGATMGGLGAATAIAVFSPKVCAKVNQEKKGHEDL